jgi:uncharacterized protein (DUF2141 family)
MKASFRGLLLALPWAVLADEAPGQGTLTIRARDFDIDAGQAVVFLYRKEDKLPKAPFRKAFGAIRDRESTLEFTDLPYGDYAAILLHDENSNGEIDHSFGIPSEPLGYTRGWKLGLFSGMPTFEKLKFRFSESENSQTIPIVFGKK